MSDSLFAQIRAAMPDPASAFLETGSRRYSYGDLDRLSTVLGHRLQALGVQKGDRVAVQVEKSPQAIFLYLACVRIGAVYLPLNTGYTLRELDYFFGDAEPRVIVCDPAKESDVSGPCRRACGCHRDTRCLRPRQPDRCRHRRDGIWHRSPARPTTSRPCSTPRAPPAAPRVPC